MEAQKVEMGVVASLNNNNNHPKVAGEEVAIVASIQ